MSKKKASEQDKLKNRIRGGNKSAIGAFLDEHEDAIDDVVGETRERKKRNKRSSELATRKVDTDQDEEKYEVVPRTSLAEELKELGETVPRPDVDENFWDTLTDEDPNKDRKKIMTTFYLDPDLHDIVQVISENRGRGYKTKLINESIRYTLESKGII